MPLRPLEERAPNARRTLANRITGSFCLPKVALAATIGSRASGSRRMVFTTAPRSPRAPSPLLPNVVAQRWMAARLGLEVTKRWISCRQMKGPTLGW
jgi:hypothetical protein